MKERVQVQSKHLVSEELLVNIWRRSSAPHPDDCFNDWRRKPQTDLGAFSSDYTYFWANWVQTNRGLSPVFDPAVIGEPIEWRTVNLKEKSLDASDAPDATLSRLNSLAARLEKLKQRRGL